MEPKMSSSNDDNTWLQVVVLISGNGSNLQAIIDDTTTPDCPFAVSAVISNNPRAYGLERAKRAGIDTRVVNHLEHPSRQRFDLALARAVDEYTPGLLALAGFMRVLGPEFVGRYPGRIMNIHPSLLPRYPGLNTHVRVLADGAGEHGASVHFVTPELDAGPVIVQATVPVLDKDTPDTLAARVLAQEHRIYPQAIRWFAEDRLRMKAGRVRLDGVSSTRPTRLQ